MQGLKCRKLLWTLYHNPGSIPCYYDGTQGLFYDEAAFAELAHSLFPDIIFAAQVDGNNAAEAATRQALTGRTPIFNARIRYGDVSAIINVLTPAPDGKWDIIQFGPLIHYPKESLFLKWHQKERLKHVQDIAFQLYCCEKSGIPIRKCCLTYIKENYVRMGALDAGKMLNLEDVTDKVIAESADIEIRLSDMRRTIEAEECPPFKMYENGADCLSRSHLASSYCPLKEKCQEIVYGKRASVKPIADVDYDILKIRDFMEALVYPLHILDIKYVCRVIPIGGGSPYDVYPFVCSLQSVDNIYSEPVSHTWLWDGKGRPQAMLLEIAGKWLGNRGSIISRYKEEFFDRISPDCEPIKARMLELVEPFNKKILGELACNGIDLYEAVLPEIKIENFYYKKRIEFIQATYNKQNCLDPQNILQGVEDNCRMDSELMLHALRKYAEFYEKAARRDKGN